MSEMIKERVDDNLQRLKLNRIQEILPEMINSAEEKQLSYLSMLDGLLAEEVSTKEDRRFKIALKTLAGEGEPSILSTINPCFSNNFNSGMVLS